MSNDRTLRKALHRKLKEEARLWAKKEALGGSFGGLIMLWVCLITVCGLTAHYWQPIPIASWSAFLWSLGICLLLIWWTYSLRRNKRLRSPEFGRVVLENLKRRLEDLHAKDRDGVMMDEDGLLIYQEIQVAEGLYTDITNSPYRRHMNCLDTETTKPEGKVRDEYLESGTLGIGAACAGPGPVQGR